MPDSDEDDEDYDWHEDDDADLPRMPPQTQGSEDILLNPVEEGDEEDDGGQGEDVGFQENSRGAGREDSDGNKSTVGEEPASDGS